MSAGLNFQPTFLFLGAIRVATPPLRAALLTIDAISRLTSSSPYMPMGLTDTVLNNPPAVKSNTIV